MRSPTSGPLMAEFHTRRRPPGGFTLLELLVSLALFAIISLIAYRGLQTALTADEAARAQAERLGRLQTLYRLVGRDLGQAIDRPIRDAFGERLPALVGQGDTLELSHTGRRNPAGLPRSLIERVAYVVADRRLYRQSWNVLDRAQDSRPRRHALLDAVEGLELRYLDDKGNWQREWRGVDDARPAAPPLPRAIEYVLDLGERGRIRWLFELPRPIRAQAKKRGSPNGQG